MEAEVSLSDVQIEPEETAPPAIAKDIPQPPREPVPTPVTAEQPAIPAPPKPQVTAPPVPPTPAPPASTPPAPTPPAPPASPEPPAAPVPDSLLDASVSQPAAPVPQPTADSCDALIRSLGLDPDLMTAETRKNFQRVLADTLRETVGGMMKVLGARNAIKNEFRMNVTMIQPMENNPLKFSPNVDEALRNMFTSQSNAYMPGTIAIREGFQDVADHQVAVIAGMRAAFRSLLKRFEPEALQVRFDKQHQAGFLSSKKGKYWEAYGDFYRDLSDNMDDAFQDLFGEDFAEAYEQQMARLEASRKK
ncbi:MAG: type VI secretion system-associated FHA domain protein TagH [Pseudomonadales bacterium]|nr:type VI secretion system-associated FHA domain protein TagH [Pseudomonadales bacterium]